MTEEEERERWVAFFPNRCCLTAAADWDSWNSWRTCFNCSRGCARERARPERGMTPLMCAVVGNHLEVVRVLLEHGADPHSRDNNEDGLTALTTRGCSAKRISTMKRWFGCCLMLEVIMNFLPCDHHRHGVCRALCETSRCSRTPNDYALSTSTSPPIWTPLPTFTSKELKNLISEPNLHGQHTIRPGLRVVDACSRTRDDVPHPRQKATTCRTSTWSVPCCLRQLAFENGGGNRGLCCLLSIHSLRCLCSLRVSLVVDVKTPGQ